jgi:hypothetical protein
MLTPRPITLSAQIVAVAMAPGLLLGDSSSRSKTVHAF